VLRLVPQLAEFASGRRGKRNGPTTNGNARDNITGDDRCKQSRAFPLRITTRADDGRGPQMRAALANERGVE